MNTYLFLVLLYSAGYVFLRKGFLYLDELKTMQREQRVKMAKIKAKIEELKNYHYESDQPAGYRIDGDGNFTAA